MRMRANPFNPENAFCTILVDRPYAAEVRDVFRKHGILYKYMHVYYKDKTCKLLHIVGDIIEIENIAMENEHIKGILTVD